MNRKILLIPSGDAPNVANAAPTAVAHGGNPLLYETLRVGVSLSQCEKTALLHQNLKSEI